MKEKHFRKLAESNFDNGLLCAESVVSSLADYQGIEKTLITKAATAFCGGMSRTCGPCGALTGAVMGLSLSLGRDSNGDSVEQAYSGSQELINRFVQEFGSKNCHELLGCDIGTEKGMAEFKSTNLRKRCINYTGRATEITVEILERNVGNSTE